MSELRALLLAALTSALLLTSSSPAQAHPDLEQGKRLTLELEFESALASFERALASGSLRREELIELLAERALLQHALQRRDDLNATLIWLAALAPDHRLDLRAPPELTGRWTSIRDQGRGALRVTLEATAKPRNRLEAKVSLSGTVPKGARARVVLREPGGKWRIVEDAELSEALPEGGLELYAEAIGLGSVVIARDRDATRPLRVSATDASPASSSAIQQETQPSGGWARRYRGVLIGSALAAVAVAAVVVVLTTHPEDGGKAKPSDSTILKPMVSF